MTCNICQSNNTELILDYGNVALAGNFLRADQVGTEAKYPLRLIFCHDCYGVQVEEQIDPDILFKNYFYSSSLIPRLNRHFELYAKQVYNRFLPLSVLEIGCNDGVMLRNFIGKVDKVYGIDPSNVTVSMVGANIINDYFSPGINLPKFDMIIANNVFAHMQDIGSVVKKIRDTLTPNGVFIFEVHSLHDMIEKNQYDWVYHEHLYYYSIHTLEVLFGMHGLRIFDAHKTELHAGSRRYYVCKDGRREKPSVSEMRDVDNRLKDFDTFKEFSVCARAHREELNLLIKHIKSEGKSIVGYGACGRANTMLQFCGITNKEIDYIIDDAKNKEAYFTPISHIPIRNSSGLDIPDYILVFAWSFLADILPRCMAPAIIPLPNIHILENKK